MTRSKLSLKGKGSTGILLFVLVSLFPSQLALHFWPNWAFVKGIRVDYLSPTLYASDILIVLFVILTIKNISKLRSIYILFWSLALVNILFSFFPAVSLISFIKIFEYFVFVIALTQNVGLVKKFAGKALSISLVWTLMLSLLQIKLGHTLGGVFYYLGERSFSINSPGISLFSANNSLYLRPYASFPHPNALAGFALIGIFLLVYLKPKSILEKLGIISGVILVMLSHSQAAWIALAVGMLLLFFRQVAIRLLRPVLFISLIISVLFLFIAPIASQANFTQQSILIRLQLNQSAWLLLKNHPLFGVGLGVFIPALQTLSLPGNFFTLPYFIYQPVHNIFLLMLVQLGGLLFIFLSTVLSKLLKSINNNHLAIAWISVIITGLVDHYWATSQQNILLLCLLVGVSLSDTMKRI